MDRVIVICCMASGVAALRLAPRRNSAKSSYEVHSVSSRRWFGHVVASSLLGIGVGIDGAWAVAPTEDEVASAAKARNEEVGRRG